MDAIPGGTPKRSLSVSFWAIERARQARSNKFGRATQPLLRECGFEIRKTGHGDVRDRQYGRGRTRLPCTGLTQPRSSPWRALDPDLLLAGRRFRSDRNPARPAQVAECARRKHCQRIPSLDVVVDRAHVRA